MDFTVNQYRKLIHSCIDTNKNICGIEGFITNNQPQHNTIVLRHDIDRSIKNALKIAEIEADHNIRSTYYFRVPYTFRPSIIKAIAALGHEIGFHYETLAKSKGDIKKAHSLFVKELEQLREISPIKTICMHGSPLSPFDNRDLWKHHDYRLLGIIGEPYLSIDYHGIFYLTDTGRSWNSDKTNLKDRVKSTLPDINVRQTKDIISFLSSTDKTIVIQTHPERWAYSPANWLLSFSRDMAANTIKSGLNFLRHK